MLIHGVTIVDIFIEQQFIIMCFNQPKRAFFYEIFITSPLMKL